MGVGTACSLAEVAMPPRAAGCLRVLLATKEIPGMRLDDFEVLHDTASAYTVYDVPIRMRSVVYALQLFVFTVMVGIYTAALAEYR